MEETLAGYGSFVTFVKSNAKALSTAVPSIKSAFAPCRGQNV
jgi:adenosine/AMP kinase